MTASLLGQGLPQVFPTFSSSAYPHSMRSNHLATTYWAGLDLASIFKNQLSRLLPDDHSSCDRRNSPNPTKSWQPICPLRWKTGIPFSSETWYSIFRNTEYHVVNPLTAIKFDELINTNNNKVRHYESPIILAFSKQPETVNKNFQN